MITKRKKSILIISGIIILALILLVYFRISDSLLESSRKPAVTPSVVIGKAEKNEISRNLSLTGDICSIQQANIYSKVSGNIEKIYCDIGDYVKQGKILALIDSTIYSQNARQALASYMQAEANFQNAKMTYDRNKSLFSQNLIAKQDVDNSKTAYDVSFAQKEAANAIYKNALTQLGYCKITAPFSGYITKRLLDAGAYVSASSSSPGSVLFILMDIGKVKVLANVPEKDLPSLAKVEDVSIKTSAFPEKVFNARIERTSQALDLSTRTMQVEIDIENKDHFLKPGMFANINMILEKKKDVLTLPHNVIMNDENGKFVYLITKDTTVLKKYIKLGIEQDNICEITEGLSSEDKVIVIGQNLIKEKMKVKISK